MSVRDEMLNRVRSAIEGGAPPSAVVRSYRRAGSSNPAERVALFCERVGEYRAEVRRVADGAVASTVSDVSGGGRLVIPPGLPSDWRPEGVDLVVDDGLDAAELDAIDGVITGCTVGIAETGTIVLTAAPAEGRRAITLVPDLHICVVQEHRIVGLVPEAISALAEAGATQRPLTLISGPSATSDIELSRVEGVHGPRNLVVLVVAADAER